MRSFKKMLAAVSAVTIAFGAMALQVGAASVTYGDNGPDNIDVEGNFDIQEGGYFRVTFTSTDANATAAQIALILRNENWSWDQLGGHYGVAADVENTYYVDFTYDEVNAACVHESVVYGIEGLKHINVANWGAWINETSVPVDLTFTDISYIAPQSETPVSFSATELEEMIAPEGEYYDGWYARTFTFSYESDASVKYAVTVDGNEIGKTGNITGAVVYGIIVSSQDQAKLASIAAPVITIQ